MAASSPPDDNWTGFNRLPGATAKHLRQWWNRLGIDTSLVVSPRRYLKISGEILFLTFSACWIITIATKPTDPYGETGKPFRYDNPIRNRIGYNNICVGFDTYPANVVALPGFVVSVYFAVRYLLLDMERAFLEFNAKRISYFVFKLSLICNAIYTLVLVQVIYFLLVPPTENAWWHLGTFLAMIWGRWFPIFGNFMDAPTWSLGEKIFLGTYTVVSHVLPWLYIADYMYYDSKYSDPEIADPPLINPIFLQIFDLLWFACLAGTSKFLPQAPDMRVSYALVNYPEDNDKDGDYEGMDEVEKGSSEEGTGLSAHEQKSTPNSKQAVVEETELTTSSPTPAETENTELLRQATGTEGAEAAV
jgi:hypothetical protein